MSNGPGRMSAAGLTQPVTIVDSAGNVLLTTTAANSVRLGATGGSLAFYGTAPIAKQTGVAVTAQGLHDALVALGLIAA